MCAPCSSIFWRRSCGGRGHERLEKNWRQDLSDHGNHPSASSEFHRGGPVPRRQLEPTDRLSHRRYVDGRNRGTPDDSAAAAAIGWKNGTQATHVALNDRRSHLGVAGHELGSDHQRGSRWRVARICSCTISGPGRLPTALRQNKTNHGWHGSHG